MMPLTILASLNLVKLILIQKQSQQGQILKIWMKMVSCQQLLQQFVAEGIIFEDKKDF